MVGSHEMVIKIFKDFIEKIFKLLITKRVGICEIVFREDEGNLFLEKMREKIDALNMYLSTIIL